MTFFDIKPEPTTAIDFHNRWINWVKAVHVSYCGKHIEIT